MREQYRKQELDFEMYRRAIQRHNKDQAAFSDCAEEFIAVERFFTTIRTATHVRFASLDRIPVCLRNDTWRGNFTSATSRLQEAEENCKMRQRIAEQELQKIKAENKRHETQRIVDFEEKQKFSKLKSIEDWRKELQEARQRLLDAHRDDAEGGQYWEEHPPNPLDDDGAVKSNKRWVLFD